MKFFTFLLCIVLFSYGEWVIKDSLSSKILIPAGNRLVISIDSEKNKIEVLEDPVNNITEKAIKAIFYAPSWLSIDLKDKFRKLSPQDQNKYADIILNEKDPYVDEVAFTVANISVEVLTDAQFPVQLIVDNVHTLYANDSVLDYVDIIDSGKVQDGGNYFSTTIYRVEENGKINQYVLPREIYYWYIVHPRLQHEFPAYINPSTGNVASPPAGKFWRSYIFDYREEGKYPSLHEELAGVKILWKCKKNSMEDNGAIGVLGLWCNKIQQWGNTPSKRIPQPVWLYHQHGGTCSEHGWFANAAGRCAIIPMTLDEGLRFDHKWNMFYERGWRDFEPINGWINRMANDYWEDPSKNLNGCFMWRGDGFIWGNTEMFTPVCTLKVKVVDRNSKPVDGALTIVDCPGRPGPFCLTGWTNSKGWVTFLVGDNIDYFTCSIQSSVGDISAKNVISKSKAGVSVLYTPELSGTLPLLKIKEAPSLSDNFISSQKIEYNISIESEILYGKHNYSFDGYSFPSTFSEKENGGSINFFMLDENNFFKYKEGKEAEALLICKDIAKIKGDIYLVNKKLYAVISNEERNLVSEVACVNFKLNCNFNSSIFNVNDVKRKAENIQIVKNNKEILFILSDVYRGDIKFEIFNINGVLVYRRSEKLKDRNGRLFFRSENLNLTKGIHLYRISDIDGKIKECGYFTIGRL